MYVRKSLSSIVVAALAGSALAFTATPALAATQADDPSFAPVATDLIGVGSDTIQTTLHFLAEGTTVNGTAVPGWNAQSPAPAQRIASFAALGGGTITLPGGDINRPNGSGAGKALLYGAGDNADIDFARSSSAINATEKQAGLQAFPFALDTLKMAVSNSVPSHAPTALTNDQIVGIYKGDITDWADLGGTAGEIAPKIPQPGSGTRSFFESQLKSMNGGVAVTYGSNVAEVQEHDDTPIKNDPNAIAPFSVGRAALLGTTLRLESGFSALRALYDVVRGTDQGNPAIQAVFGEDGFVCSTAARPLIEASGFQQLATPAHGGVCGAPTSDPTSNFTLNEQVATASTLGASSPSARAAHLVARASASTSPQGSFDFYEGDTLLQSGVPLVSGQATYDVTGAAPGSHTYTAMFVPADGFDASEATDSVVVKTSSKITESFASKVKKGKRAKGTITVALAGVDNSATGLVKVLKGHKVIGKGKLSGGTVTIKLARLAKGKNKLKAVWAGNSAAAGSTKKFTITQK